MTEPISDLLDMVRVKGTAYFSKNIAAPWGMEVDQHDNLCRFHLVLSGSAWVGLTDGADQELLEEGDFVIVPRGHRHFLGDVPEHAERSLHQIPGPNFQPEFARAEDPSFETYLLCGYFQLAQGVPSILTSQLPNLLITKKRTAKQSQQVGRIAHLLKDELSQQGRPQSMLLNRLTEILFYYAIREWLDAALLPDGALQAIGDAKLQRVFREIHQNPAANWTVESLAKIAGQSRTVFAAHFKRATGVSPITYLSQWRTELARKMLNETNNGIDQIALETGYQDTNAFSRAFKRATGSPPGVFRRSARS